MGESFTGHESPEDWPGHIWCEGRTLVHLKSDQSRPTHMPRGPAAKSGTGFMNPAMAPARTRSVLLLQDALQHGWVNLTALFERWMHFVLQDSGPSVEKRDFSRTSILLHITANDLDKSALDWALASMASDEEIEHASS